MFLLLGNFNAMGFKFSEFLNSFDLVMDLVLFKVYLKTETLGIIYKMKNFLAFSFCVSNHISINLACFKYSRSVFVFFKTFHPILEN